MHQPIDMEENNPKALYPINQDGLTAGQLRYISALEVICRGILSDENNPELGCSRAELIASVGLDINRMLDQNWQSH